MAFLVVSLQIPRSRQSPSSGGLAGVVIAILLIVIFAVGFVLVLSLYEETTTPKPLDTVGKARIEGFFLSSIGTQVSTECGKFTLLKWIVLLNKLLHYCVCFCLLLQLDLVHHQLGKESITEEHLQNTLKHSFTIILFVDLFDYQCSNDPYQSQFVSNDLFLTVACNSLSSWVWDGTL